VDDQSISNMDSSGLGTVIHNIYRNHTAKPSPGKNRLVKIRRRMDVIDSNDDNDKEHQPVVVAVDDVDDFDLVCGTSDPMAAAAVVVV
jgi:hypothetical protein